MCISLFKKIKLKLNVFCGQVGRLENAIGWYHSHPGYGCWLSGIDVSTQMLNQNFQEPFVAIVIDPVRTISAGKVCLGAFRTYPKVCIIMIVAKMRKCNSFDIALMSFCCYYDHTHFFFFFVFNIEVIM
jgi:hypothetical protein